MSLYSKTWAMVPKTTDTSRLFFGSLGLILFCSQAMSETKNTDFSADFLGLTERIELWEGEAFWCEGTPAKKNCDDGDMTLFNGLLCSVGIEVGCQGVGGSQDLDGRWWRSPRRKDNLNFGERNSFSRDMSLGVLLYLVKSKNYFAAESWLRWIEKNRPCSLKKPFGGCWLYGPERYCRDDSQGICTISPNNWRDLYLVWNYLGLKPNKRMLKFAKRNAKAAKTEVSRIKEGYQLHLKAVSIWLHQLVGEQDSLDSELLDIILDKEPNNPFFRFLKEGATESVP